MASFHSKAEAQLARKYGPDAWEWMPNWGKVRNRLSEQIYQRHNTFMLYATTVIAAVIGSVTTTVIATLILRG